MYLMSKNTVPAQIDFDKSRLSQYLFKQFFNC